MESKDNENEPKRRIWRRLGCSRLAGVRFGSGSGVLGLNLNLHLEVRFKLEVNTNLNIVFRFGRFGSGSNNVQCINS